MAPTKGRFFACSASVGAFLGAAAALVPASCGGTVQTPGMSTSTGGTSGAGGSGNTGTGNAGTGGTGNKGTGNTGTGNVGTGGMGTGGHGGMGTGGMGTGGMMIQDAGSELDGTLIDLDGQADAPHVPPEGGDADMS